MSIKIGSLLEHHLWRFKGFNDCRRNDESFIWLKQGKIGEFFYLLFIFIVHSYTEMFSLTQNRDFFLWVYWGKLNMVLKLRKSKSNSKKGSWFGVETREIWPFEAKLCKGYAVMGSHTGLILFTCLHSFLAHLLGLKGFKL